jgi:hypothetical protein
MERPQGGRSICIQWAPARRRSVETCPPVDLTEYSLSGNNLFVFVIIMGIFRGRVVGIAGADTSHPAGRGRWGWAAQQCHRAYRRPTRS